MARCGYCSGKKIVPCEYCSGELDLCPACGGSGMQLCPVCACGKKSLATAKVFVFLGK